MKPGTKRKTVWLMVDGKPNTLRGHSKALGYHAGYATTVAKRWGCRQSEVPLEGWKEVFGQSAEFCKRPANWQEIVYGDERGSQKNRELGLGINYPKQRAEPPTMSEVLCMRFATMRLTQNPASRTPGYY